MATQGSNVRTSYEFGWEMFNHHPHYSSDLAPSDFHLFLHVKKFLSGQRQSLQNDREAEMSIIMVLNPDVRFLRHRIQKLIPRYDKCVNSGVNMLKNSSKLAVSVPINLSIKLSFVSVNNLRETYFVDALCM